MTVPVTESARNGSPFAPARDADDAPPQAAESSSSTPLPLADGLFGQDAMTFDDVLLVPGYAEVLPADVDITIRLHRNLALNIPIISAAMDTVTEADLAIALARQGGLGVIHRNLSETQQAEEVDKVKRSESGMIVDPITLRPENTLADAEAVMSHYHISGVPIIDDDKRLLGILTNRDVRFATDHQRLISDYMVSENLITATAGHNAGRSAGDPPSLPYRKAASGRSRTATSKG